MTSARKKTTKAAPVAVSAGPKKATKEEVQSKQDLFNVKFQALMDEFNPQIVPFVVSPLGKEMDPSLFVPDSMDIRFVFVVKEEDEGESQEGEGEDSEE